MEPELLNEIDCGNFFDQIDDLIEFPPDNEFGDANLVSSSDCKDYPTWDEALQDCHPLFSATDLAAELSVPHEDIVQLEWLSTFVEDSFSGGGLTIGKENLCINNDSTHNESLTSSPVSVVESSSSSSSSFSGDKTMPLSPCNRGSQRARSKRPRPTTFNPRSPIQLISPSSSSVENPHAAGSYFAESWPVNHIHKPAAGYQQKKIKITLPASSTATHQEAVRKCLHCEITKTPQWRAGPMGPKSLCNACGVRFKSGRLFPEYRPAASPTFVPALHSNSHKKVLEMRVKLETTQTAAEAKHVSLDK